MLFLIISYYLPITCRALPTCNSDVMSQWFQEHICYQLVFPQQLKHSNQPQLTAYSTVKVLSSYTSILKHKKVESARRPNYPLKILKFIERIKQQRNRNWQSRYKQLYHFLAKLFLVKEPSPFLTELGINQKKLQIMDKYTVPSPTQMFLSSARHQIVVPVKNLSYFITKMNTHSFRARFIQI